MDRVERNEWFPARQLLFWNTPVTILHLLVSWRSNPGVSYSLSSLWCKQKWDKAQYHCIRHAQRALRWGGASRSHALCGAMSRRRAAGWTSVSFSAGRTKPRKKLCVCGEKEKPDEKQSKPLFLSFLFFFFLSLEWTNRPKKEKKRMKFLFCWWKDWHTNGTVSVPQVSFWTVCFRVWNSASTHTHTHTHRHSLCLALRGAHNTMAWKDPPLRSH